MRRNSDITVFLQFDLVGPNPTFKRNQLRLCKEFECSLDISGAEGHFDFGESRDRTNFLPLEHERTTQTAFIGHFTPLFLRQVMLDILSPPDNGGLTCNHLVVSLVKSRPMQLVALGADWKTSRII